MEINMDPSELVPLEAHQSLRPRRKPSRQSSHSCHQTPVRALRLLLLLVLLPSAFIMVPLYMRYRVFQSQMYPMGMTDMRLIDGKISPTWCQRQVVKSNSTFNAFVVPGAPSLADELVPVSMVRELKLEDDMKEYWGFYLLQGSTVTVSACVRRPGASLIMIKGYKHLKECAYIGDDSSEEVDELVKAFSVGKITDKQYEEELQKLQPKKERAKTNSPGAMKRQKAGVSFLDPSQSGDVTPSHDTQTNGDVTDHDPKELRDILEKLHAIRQAAKDEKAKTYKPPDHLVAVPALHRHRDTNVDRDERQWLSFKDIDGNSKTVESNSAGDMKMKPEDKSTVVVTKSDSETNKNITITGYKSNINETKETIENGKENQKSEFNSSNEIKHTEKTLQDKVLRKDNTVQTDDNTTNTKKSSSQINSKKVLEEVVNRLQSLGNRGKRVLRKLQTTMTDGDQPSIETLSKASIMSKLTESDEELDRLRKLLVEAIDEEKTRSQREDKRRKANEDARAKREIYLERSLNEDDESRNSAAEEGLDLNPDGYAEHHTRLNESTPLDMSRSEFWSSFSSSEERLLECEGLILNLPLSPSVHCEAERSEKARLLAAEKNAVTYRVPANGYYFFVFNSENEVDINYINVRFDLQKTRYDIARTALRECRNSTEHCSLLLDIFSSQKVVLELPLRDNSSLWNEQFVVVSECEPRTSIYLACAVAVPVLIVLFAFQ